MGIPLTTQDGMITGGGIINPAFVGFSADATAALTDGTVISNKVEVTDGSIYTPIGAKGPNPSTNKVLIAQITTNGVFDYELNILLRTPAGEGQFYAAHPLSGDLFIPSLIGHFDPNAKAYAVKEISGTCSDASFCLPIVANDSVKNVIGYDMVLNYDTTKVHPSGNITISNELITAGYASYAVNNNAATGEINISVFLNANAPANASFNGTGELLCIEFIKEPSVPAIDTIAFNMTYLQESYVNGVNTKLVDAGSYISKKNPFYKGSLEFWTDHSPIKYNSINPSQYLSTTIFGVDSNCDNQSAYGALPDLNGDFNYILANGTSIKIIRDISPFTDVQPVINGYDASLAHKVVLNDLSFIPSIFQAIALDVNMDGVISSGDISQINQRSVKTIPEFKQKWNYTNNGTSNGQLSKDWIFVDSLLLAGSAYKVSSTYPSNDGTGYSKAKVPVPPFCFQLPVFNSATCNIYGNPVYTGILYGDVDGNYDSIPNDGQLKRELAKEKGSIYLNIDQAIVNGSYVDIPVSFISPKKVVSLDFAVKLQNKVKFDRIINQVPYLTDALANYAMDDQTLRFTSNSGQPYEEGKNIAFIRFSNADKQLSNSDLTDLTGYLNGEQVNMELKGYVTTNISTASSSMGTVQIYPNPASSLLHVISTEKAVVELTDLQGRQVIATAAVNANERLELNTESIANGTYLLKVYNDHFVSTQRVVIENNK